MEKTCQSLLLISLYKVENKKEKLEDFKTAISSTVKSLANSEKIEVSFGNQNPKSEKNSIKLPDINQTNNKIPGIGFNNRKPLSTEERFFFFLSKMANESSTINQVKVNR